jgi:hypothetical protein
MVRFLKILVDYFILFREHPFVSAIKIFIVVGNIRDGRNDVTSQKLSEDLLEFSINRSLVNLADTSSFAVLSSFRCVCQVCDKHTHRSGSLMSPRQ